MNAYLMWASLSISCQASPDETAAMEYQEEMDMEQASVEAEKYVDHTTVEEHYTSLQASLTPCTTSILLHCMVTP